MNSELEDMLKENQRLLRETLRATNRLSRLATAMAENHEERLTRLTRLAEHDNGRLDRVEEVLKNLSGRLDELGSRLEESTKHHTHRLDRVDSTLDRLASLIEQFVRGNRGNGHTPRRSGQK